MLFMHRETGSIDTEEGWIASYSQEELEYRGFSSAEEAFEADEDTMLFPVL